MWGPCFSACRDGPKVKLYCNYQCLPRVLAEPYAYYAAHRRTVPMATTSPRPRELVCHDMLCEVLDPKPCCNAQAHGTYGDDQPAPTRAGLP